LYQALTGQLPFAGDALEIAAHKQRGQVAAPRAFVPAIHAALNDLCLALLHPAPTARPTAVEILRALDDGETATPMPPSAQDAAPFVGRSSELRALARALEDTRQGRPVVVFVSGESGIGKSALVQRFADDCRGNGATVLAGRCYERESVPFKAIDGIVDALSRHLARLPAVEAAAALPRQAALLARAFPVLARVKPIAEAPHRLDVRDPQELRACLFGALRELLARLADRRPVMLIVDDVDWADAGSFALLAELLRPPDAPALLLVVTGRGSGSATESAHIAAARAALGTEVHELHVSRMAAGEAHVLAALFLARQTSRADLDPAAVAEEAHGHPLFMGELVRGSHADATLPVRLDDCLWARVAKLDPATRAILQLAALSSGRLTRRTAALAAHLDSGAFESHLSLLCSAHLVRTSGMSGTDHLEPYHDRVRAAVVAHTGGDEARAFHRRLALALEAEAHPDAEAVALHWSEAGERERAAEHAALAGARAARALAFDQAARLYRLALELRAAAGSSDRATEQGLRVDLAEALVNSGRGAEAANIYLAAAESVATADACALRRRAGEQLLRSGHIDEGMATLRTTLQPLGIEVATTPMQARRSLLLRRAQVRLRGLCHRERDPTELPARTLTRIDLCWSLSSSLSFVDPVLGSDLSALHLLLALRAGEPSRVCRALAFEAVYAAGVGAALRGQRLLARAHEIAARLDQPYVSGILGLCSGMVATFLGSFAEAYSYMEKAETILHTGATGVAWELDVVHVFELEMLGWMGCLNELRRRIPIALREAESRNDLYFSTSLRVGLPNNLIWLQLDDVEQARRETIEALRSWARPGFQIQHYWNLYTQVQIDLYSGDGEAAHARLLEQWTRLKSSLLLHVPYFRIPMRELRARCALAAARQLGERAPSEARALIAGAERDIGRLRRERVAWADALAWLLQAGVAHLKADDAGVRGNLARAVEAFSAVDMALFATAAQQRLAELRSDHDGAALADSVASWLSRHDIKAPARMIAMMTPAFD
jgi:predicted ATPase